MSPLAPSTASQNDESSRALLAELLSNLQTSQNSEGGWAFHPGGASRVEPTCWALLARAIHRKGKIRPSRAAVALRRLSAGFEPVAEVFEVAQRRETARLA